MAMISASGRCGNRSSGLFTPVLRHHFHPPVCVYEVGFKYMDDGHNLVMNAKDRGMQSRSSRAIDQSDINIKAFSPKQAC